MKQERLKDKVIVISGGTKGVGRAFAEVAGREGAKVVIGGRDEKAAKKALRIIRTYGTDRVLFGSDYPMWSPKKELENFFALGLTEEENRAILWDNAARLLNL